MIDSETIMWPDEVPTPLIGRKHRFLSMTQNTRMDSERVRRRRLLTSPIHLIDVSWNMDADSFDAFKTFYDETLVNGEQLFGMITYDPHPNTSYRYEVTRLLGFREPYSFSQTDNNFAVSALLEVTWETREQVTNPFSPIPELEYEFHSEECKHAFTVSFTIPEGDSDTYVLQIASSADGPWGDHVYAALDGEEETPFQKDIVLNNDYQGEAWFRVVKPDGSLHRLPVNVPASTLAPPTIEITNLDLSTRELRSDEGFTFPYSSRENAWISLDETYVVPRGRMELSGDKSDVSTFDQIVTVTGEAGATHKWTRNALEPTANTIIQKIDGYENNLGVHRTDFGYIIKARSFKDGCQSPLTCMLVDRRFTNLTDGWYRASGLGNTVSGSCDYPHPESGAESGGSCNLNFGGTSEFDDYITALAEEVAQPVNNGIIVRSVSYSTQDQSAWYGGYTTRVGAATYYEHTDSFIHRDGGFWNSARPSFLFGEIQLAEGTTGTGTEVTTLQGINESGETMAGPSNASTAFEDEVTEWINNRLLELGTTSLSVKKLEMVLTLHQDFIAPTDAEYEPPVVDDPPEEYEEPDPELDIYWDPFEAYSNTDDAAAAVLNEYADDWDGAWVIEDREPDFVMEDFESYSTGSVPETEDFDELVDEPLDGGDGFSGAWEFRADPLEFVHTEDFEDYASGTLTIAVQINGGEGFDGPWEIRENGLNSTGLDAFETYATGDISEGSSGLNGGTLFGDSEGWYIYDRSYASTNILFGFDGTDGSTTINDESRFALSLIGATPHSIARFGNAQLDTDQSKFGSASLLLDGSGDYITVDTGTFLILDFTAPWTIECFVRVSSLPGAVRYAFSKSGAGYTTGFALGVRSTNAFFGQVGTGSGEASIIGSATIQANTWHHLALTFDGATLRLFADGVLQGSSAAAPSAGTAAFHIGRDPNTTTRDWSGWIDELRVAQNCLYTADFTPPTVPFPRS